MAILDEKFVQIFVNKAREELGDEAYAPAQVAGRELGVAQALKEGKEWLKKKS